MFTCPIAVTASVISKGRGKFMLGTQDHHAELCIVGAGISGLNALYAASKTLPAGSKVVLVDKNLAVGGMWNDVYDYVRLHQPHPFFTVGDIQWQIDKPDSYLANKQEILTHFQHCLTQLRARLEMTELFGYEYLSHTENASGIVELTCRNLSSQKTVQVRAARFVKSTGFNVVPNTPLKLSCTQLYSTTPEDPVLFGPQMRDSDKPVYIIGGGKTAMDTACQLLRTYPDKTIYVIAGRGTYFINREALFPEGVKRYWQGTLALDLFRECAIRFNGDNEQELTEFMKRYCHAPDYRAEHHFFGLLSLEELTVVKSGCREIIMDYLEDIVDQDGLVKMLFRKREPMTIESGSWVINCTGSLLRSSSLPEPYISQSGRVMSVNQTDSSIVFSTFGGYFLGHMFFDEKLKDFPLYGMNHEAIIKANKEAYPFVAFTQLLYNFYTFVDALPLQTILRCHLDFHKWYPLHRQAFVMAKLLLNKKRYRRHFKQSLDRFHSRYGL